MSEHEYEHEHEHHFIEHEHEHHSIEHEHELACNTSCEQREVSVNTLLSVAAHHDGGADSKADDAY